MLPTPSSHEQLLVSTSRVHPRTRAGAAKAAAWLAADQDVKTYLDVLPPELIQLILDYVLPITANSTSSILGFHNAWPGSYYARVSEPLLHSILRIPSKTLYKSLSEFLDRILARPGVRYWCKSLRWVQGRDGSDDTTKINPWVYIGILLKNLSAIEKSGLGRQTPAERHISKVILKEWRSQARPKPRFSKDSIFALLVSLLPNLERLEIYGPLILHSEWNDDYLATIINQFRNTLEGNRGFATRSQISLSDLGKYYSSLPSEVQLRNNNVNKISPLLLNIRSISFGTGASQANNHIHSTGNIIWAFFLPKITEINIRRLFLQRYHTQPSPLQRLNKQYVAEDLIVQKLSLQHLYCSSPVTSLKVVHGYLSYGMECLLRLPKVLREFSYFSSVDKNRSCWPVIWNGLKWHKDTLERLEIGYHYAKCLDDIEEHGTRELRDLLCSLKDFDRLKYLKLAIYQASVAAICETTVKDRAARCQSTILPRSLNHMIIRTWYTGDTVEFTRTLAFLMEILEMKKTALPNLQVLQVDFQLQQGEDTPAKFLGVLNVNISILRAVAKEKGVDIVLGTRRRLFVAQGT